MKASSFLYLVLGAWLSGSIILGAIVAYNFAGFDDLFARNPKLAERAGFNLADEQTKKTSLLWVHSSELNRVFFDVWNQTQLVLGSLAVALAFRARAARLPILLLLLAVALVAHAHFSVGSQVEELGRQLDFAPRIPPPPELALFKQAHGRYFALETLRFLLLCAATIMLLFRYPGTNSK